MISVELALRLRAAGLGWKPASGDRFVIPGREMDADVFVVSELTIDVHQGPTGPLIRFNGTVEWALDDVAKEEAVWLPHEAQLRDLLGGTFRRLTRVADGYRVDMEILGVPADFSAGTPVEAYALALLHLLTAAGAGDRT